MKKFFSWILFTFCVFAYGTEYTISSVDEFNDLSLSAGDTVIWQDGTYSSDERITFSGSGTSSNPITLKAETRGGVVFTGGLQMDIAGSYLVVDGFYWNGGYGASNFIQFRNGTTYAQNSTIQYCAINGLEAEPDDAAEAAAEGSVIKHRWIVLYGNYNNVLNCTFMNKSTAGALVLAEYEYNAEEDRCKEVGHTIMNNYFYNYEKIDPDLSNAGDSETIRIGTSEYQNVNSQALVSGNYFVQADGENEIITNKSANNTYSNNTFRRCRGSLVMRHGANATVTGNYFLGENTEGTGAIRIADSDHTITNNYIQDCVTTTDFAIWNNGLTFVGGNTSSVPDCTSTNVSNAYQDVENITFSNNTFVNTDSPFHFNDSRDGADNVYGTVADNLIYFDSGNDNISNVISGSYTEIGNTLTFSGNIYDGTDLGESASGFTSGNLSSSSNGEIYTISGGGSAGASISNDPLTDNDVASTVGACFLSASGSLLANCDGSTTVDNLTATSLSTFDADGGSQSISISSNINWSVSESSSWVSIDTTSGSNNGTSEVTVSENTSTSSRSTTVTISGGDITRSVTISQEGAEDNDNDDNDNDSTYTNIPTLIQAEDYDDQSGTQIEDTQDTGGGDNVGYIDTDDFLSYNINAPSSGDYVIDFRVASRSNGTSFDIYSGNLIIGSVSSDATGNWQIWETVSETVSLNQGEQTITLVATGRGWNINWLEFTEGENNEEEEEEEPTSSCTSGTNLALNGTVVDYSDQQNTTNSVDNIIDDNDDNRWSAEGFPQYATIDLGDEYAIDEINLATFNDRDYQFTVEGSTSSASSGFSTLVDASDNSDSGPINRSFSSQTVRYVKLTITGANSYTGNWSSISDFEIICAGSSASKLETAEKSSLETSFIEINTYPNPFTKEINISGDIETGSTVRLIDVSGKIIIRENTNSSATSLTNLTQLAKGLYILQIIKDDQIIFSKKVIKN